MSQTFVFDGHEYRDAEGRVYGSTVELLGTVLLDVTKECWFVEPADDADGWVVHVNEPGARETAIRGLIASTY